MKQNIKIISLFPVSIYRHPDEGKGLKYHNPNKDIIALGFELNVQ